MPEAHPYQVLVYERSDGSIPYQDWLRRLKDKQSSARIARRLNRQVPAGNLGDFKALQGVQGLYEFRFDMGPGYRVYCGIHGQTIIILLCGGDKSSQDRDIRKAEEYWNDFIQREADRGTD